MEEKDVSIHASKRCGGSSILFDQSKPALGYSLNTSAKKIKLHLAITPFQP